MHADMILQHVGVVGSGMRDLPARRRPFRAEHPVHHAEYLRILLGHQLDIRCLNDDEYILFLGGFKGKINSLNGEINIDDIKSGFSLDRKSVV